MMKVFRILISYAMIQLLLVNGDIQSSCSSTPIVEVKPQNGKYEPIPNNTIIYRSINATGFAARCQCDNDTIIPSWSFPVDSTLANLFGGNISKCLDNRTCIMNKTLSFPSLKKEHSGYYKCHGNSNYIGFMLCVIGVPIILQPQMTRKVPLNGSNVTLQCGATGEGLLNYYWEKEDSGNWITINNMTSYSATISGRYRCNVSNEVGSVVSPVITVYGPPRFLIHPISQTVTAGMSITLYCNVSGYKVSYVWERRTDGSAWSRISDSQNYKYEVKNIRQSQQYRCIPGNDAKSLISDIAIIQVLKIVTHPHNKQSKIGSRVLTLTCESSKLSSDVTFTWTHNGTIISNYQAVNSYTSRLTISNVQYSDSGNYTCIVAKGSLSVTSDIAIITVYVGKPVIITNPSNAKVPALTNVTFTCSASNINGVTHSFSWHRSNGNIPNTRSTGQNTNALTITRVTPLDVGKYYCTVTNDAGSASSQRATLRVNDKLSISVSPQRLTVEEGEIATFTATGSGIKTTAFKYQWFKIEGSNIILVERNRQLMIDNVKIKDDGNYYCNITNEWKERKMSKLVQLTVNAISSAFTTDPHNQFVNINEDAVFVCAANGSESLTISWTRNKVHVTSSRLKISNDIINGERRSVLAVKNSTIRDSGLYRCVTTNADNEMISSKPAELLILPSIKVHPNSTTILTGQPVNLRCGAIGTNVMYQWMRNGVIISDDNSFVLTIDEIRQSDDGIYQCIASNKGGNATSNPAMITVYDNPTINLLSNQTLGVLGEQFQITCKATNDKNAPHNMMFTWMTPDGVDYNVNMTSDDDDHTASSTLYISSLAKSDNGTYKCYVTNNNVSNVSILTSTTVIVEERPPQPLNFNVTSQNTTSLKLSWSGSENVNDEINYYIIYYSDGKRMETIKVFNFTGSYVLTNLTPSTQYRIHVRSVRFTGINNETLESISSVTINTATLDDPSAAQSGSSVTGIIVGIVAALILVIIIIILILIVYFWKRKGHLKHKLLVNAITTNNSIDLKERAFGDEAKKPIPVKHESPSSINNTEIMPVIDMTYSIEVHTSADQPTTLLLEVPDVIEENVTWFKDGERSSHPLLKDGSLYISHTKLSDQGEYTAMVTRDYDDTSSKAYTVMVVDIKCYWTSMVAK